MNQPLWKTLVELSHSDNKIQEELSRHSQLQNAIEEKKSSTKSIKQALSYAEDQRKSLSQEIQSIERKLEDINQVIHEKKSRLEKLASNREINALKKELSTIGLEHQDFENQLLALWNQKDITEKKLLTLNAEYKSNTIKLENDLKELEEKGREILKIIQDLETEQKSIETQIPEEWLSRYKKMKVRVTNPIVPVLPTATSCSVCFYHILPQDVARLKKNALINCRNCYRLLYHPEAVGAHSSTSQ